MSWANNCNRSSGVVSIKRFPSRNPNMTLQRMRRFLGLSLVHVAHLHPIIGTPCEVPVPKKTSFPVISLL